MSSYFVNKLHGHSNFNSWLKPTVAFRILYLHFEQHAVQAFLSKEVLERKLQLYSGFEWPLLLKSKMCSKV